MSRPSAPLVDRLRKIIEARELSVANLALQVGSTADRLSAVFAGDVPMHVDELIQISQALELGPEDLDVGEAGTSPTSADDALPYDPPETPEATPPERDVVTLPFAADIEDEPELSDLIDPEGNQILQLFQVGFSLGCTFFFQAETDQLAGSGIPAAVLKRYADAQVPIQLDAAYHVYNEPSFSETHVTLKLSFDAIYTCTFPWSSIRRVAFFPEVPELDDDPEDEEEEEEAPSRGAPFLRLVE